MRAGRGAARAPATRGLLGSAAPRRPRGRRRGGFGGFLRRLLVRRRRAARAACIAGLVALFLAGCGDGADPVAPSPRPDLLHADGLHLSAAGYALWTRIVTPRLPPAPP